MLYARLSLALASSIIHTRLVLRLVGGRNLNIIKKIKDCGGNMDKSKPKCPQCGSENTYGISRVVGYYSKIENWNTGKKVEFKDRQKGKYEVGEKGKK